MNKVSRRKFLKTILVGSAAIITDQLAISCASQAPQGGVTQVNKPDKASPTVPLQAENPTQAVFPTTGATNPSEAPIIMPTEEATAIPSDTPMSFPDLVVARNAEPEDLVRRAISGLGGMGRFVKSGANVIIKPNICVDYHSYEYAATTNPWVVGALVKLCFEAGAGSVRVMDSPFGGSAESAYAISGIADQVNAAGGEMVIMQDFKFIQTDIPQGIDLKSTQIYDDILNADVLINVPVAKNHGLARLTLGMKNLLGVIYDRPNMHRDLGQRLPDLASRVYPTLTVVDAVRIMTTNGPTGGSLDFVQKRDTIIASADIVAADSYGATLFGLQPLDLSYVRKGTEMGLGRSDLQAMNILEI